MKIAFFYENLHEGVLASGTKTMDAARHLHDAGMDLLYLTPDSWERDRKVIDNIREKLGVGIEGMHYFCEFPRDPETPAFKRAIDLAAEAGAGSLLIIPGFFMTGNTDRDLRVMADGVRRAVEYGQEKNVPVVMEDFDGVFAPYNCIAGLRWFLDRVEGLGCAFDTGNFSLFRENEVEALDIFADKIRTVHLKDRCCSPRHPGDTPFLCADGKPVYACRIGSGYISIAKILDRLRLKGYEGNVIAELYAVDPKFILADAAESIAWIRRRLEE